jgi:hypothetical protein
VTRYEDALRSRGREWTALPGGGDTRTTLMLSPEERDALADAVNALRSLMPLSFGWATPSGQVQDTVAFARAALARLDALTHAPEASHPGGRRGRNR